MLGLAAFTAHVGFGLGGSGRDWFFNDFVYNGLELLAAAACLLWPGRAWLLSSTRSGPPP